jgi:ABC-type cobalamin/Fe3+-siderophores transport system ATPase subunit
VTTTALDSAPGGVCLVELVGPAGAGKSTVFESLLARGQAIQGRPTLRKRKYAGAVAVNVVGALATLVRQGVIGRDVSTEQVRMMMYLQTLPRILAGFSAGATAIVFDQGPLFFLTRPSLMDKRLATWRSRMLDTWAPLLDIVVYLDAPDGLLRERINTRGKWHALRGAESASALDVLTASRRVYQHAVGELAARGQGPVTLRFDTSTRSAEDIAGTILSAMADTDDDARRSREVGVSW